MKMKGRSWVFAGFVGFMICMAGLLCISPSVLASFHDNGNGTVSDTSTGLMWQQDSARDEWGNYDTMTWEEALARTAEGLRSVAERHGADALGFVSSSRCTVEENYLVQKLARAVLGTNNVHQCAAT